MKDLFGREITYLRISVTDLCNLRCKYCMPDGVCQKQHEDILTLEETCRIASILVKMGIRKIRLTGGEPLIRKNMISLVQRLSDLAEKPELALTTNGVLLEDYLEGLKAAQLSHLNISLDTRNREVFKNLTGVDAYDQVDPELIKVMKKALCNIRDYHSRQRQNSWFETKEDGSILGMRVSPIARAGVYVPGGKAAYPSSVLMNVIPAKVAGVKDIIMTTPPGKDGKVNAGTLVAADIAGVDRIFDMGRTTVNIVGDASCSIIVSNLERRKAAKAAGK